MLDRKVKTVRALERGLDVLIEVQTRKAASLHELHQATGLAKACDFYLKCELPMRV